MISRLKHMGKVPLILLIAFVTFVITTGELTLTSKATVSQPVYICQQFNGCDNNQFLEVFDHNGSPIFSVGATGGSKTFGDNASVYKPQEVFNPSVVESYTDPATYNATFGLANTCKAPELWIEPRAFWTCNSYGHWVKHSI